MTFPTSYEFDQMNLSFLDPIVDRGLIPSPERAHMYLDLVNRVYMFAADERRVSARLRWRFAVKNVLLTRKMQKLVHTEYKFHQLQVEQTTKPVKVDFSVIGGQVKRHSHVTEARPLVSVVAPGVNGFPLSATNVKALLCGALLGSELSSRAYGFGFKPITFTVKKVYGCGKELVISPKKVYQKLKCRKRTFPAELIPVKETTVLTVVSVDPGPQPVLPIL